MHDQHVFRLSEIQDALGNPEKFPAIFEIRIDFEINKYKYQRD